MTTTRQLEDDKTPDAWDRADVPERFHHRTADEFNFIRGLGTWSVKGKLRTHRGHLERYLRILAERPLETSGEVALDEVRTFIEARLREPGIHADREPGVRK